MELMEKNLLLSVVVPIFNEEDALWSMADQLASACDLTAGQGNWNFVLIDNGSTDGTPAITDKILTTWPGSQLIHLKRPNYGDALHAGLTQAKGEWAYIINVDFWDPVFLDWSWKNRNRYDLILGSKRSDVTLNQQFKYRKTLSWGLNSILQFTFGFVGTDTHGQKLVKLSSMRPLLNSCVLRRGQYDTEFTLRALRAGLWLAEVPVPIVELRPPKNLMLAKIYRNIVDILRLRKIMKKVPYHGSIRYHRWARADMTESPVQQ
jgi:glycosyltransferase involved in cell wall biosynthesis